MYIRVYTRGHYAPGMGALRVSEVLPGQLERAGPVEVQL